SALLMVRIEPMAEASLPDMRARSRPGTAIAAMMPMIATTISSSMRVKPSFFCIFFKFNLLERSGRALRFSCNRRFVDGAFVMAEQGGKSGANLSHANTVVQHPVVQQLIGRALTLNS